MKRVTDYPQLTPRFTRADLAAIYKRDQVLYRTADGLLVELSDGDCHDEDPIRSVTVYARPSRSAPVLASVHNNEEIDDDVFPHEAYVDGPDTWIDLVAEALKRADRVRATKRPGATKGRRNCGC